MELPATKLGNKGGKMKKLNLSVLKEPNVISGFGMILGAIFLLYLKSYSISTGLVMPLWFDILVSLGLLGWILGTLIFIISKLTK